MHQILRNFVLITSVYNKKGKQFAFGIIMEEKPKTVFFPHWVIKAFDISEDDQGTEFDCLFVERASDRHPMVIGIVETEDLQASIVVGHYSGLPGTDTFKPVIEEIA